MESSFRAGGLASGLDTNNIVDTLTQLESRSLNQLRSRQTALRSQVSSLADLSARLAALQKAAKGLGTDGVLGLKVTTAAESGLNAVAGPGAQAGRYAVKVDTLATAARARSAAFAQPTAPVTGGTLHLDVMGARYDVEIDDGAALADVALAINRSGAPVSATVLNDGTNSFLSLTNRDSGHPIGASPSTGLAVSQTVTGTAGSPLALSVVSPAQNARVTVDGLTFERRTNTVTDVVPHLTLSLSREGAALDLVVETDTTATASNLQKFVDAYNDIVSRLQRQLAVDGDTTRATSLGGDRAVQSLQQRLGALVSLEVPGLGAVRTLADLGIKTERNGTLTLDQAALGRAVAKDPGAVNALFSTASSGVAARLDALTKAFTDPVDGVFTARGKGLDQSVARLDQEATRMQVRIDGFRKNLIAQFAAMETVMSNLRSIGNFLTQQELYATRKTE